MPDFRRGAAAVEASLAKAKSGGGGAFYRFAPSIYWTDPEKDKDNAVRYIAFLNLIDDIPQVDYIGYVPVHVEGRDKPFYDAVIARTDSSIGESKDPMTEEWNAQPKETHVAVAVELEPDYEEVRGRKRPIGFRVATTEYDRRVRDEEGELTEETETVTQPVIGFVTQSPHNFFNLLTAFDANNAPIECTPLQISRLDQKTYSLNGYETLPVDFGDLIEYLEGVSYLTDEEQDKLFDEIDAVESDEDAALAIGAFFLDKRLAELADGERYDKLLEGIDEPFKSFGGDKKKGGKGRSKPASRRERPARRSQRRSESDPAETPEKEATPDPEPEAGAPVEEKPTPRARRSRAKPKDEAPAEPEAEPADEAPKTSRASNIQKLRERQAARKAGAAA